MSKEKNKKKTVVTTTVTTTTEEIMENKIVETHYLLILDKSGSMESVRKSTIDNFNEQIQTIKKLDKEFEDQKYFISLSTFNENIQDVMLDIPVSEVNELTMETYVPNGGTALLDAMGQGITKLQDKLIPAMKNDSEKIISAIVVIMTDGGENASKNWNQARVKELVEKLNKDQRWTITFLGANQDSFLTGSNYGIAKGNTLNFMSTNSGTRGVADALSATLQSRAMDIQSGYSSVVGGGKSNAVYFSSVLDNEVTISDEDIKLKESYNKDSKNKKSDKDSTSKK